MADRLAMTLVGPLEHLATVVGETVGGAVQQYFLLVRVQAQNEQLREDVRRLRLSAQTLRSVYARNRDLEALLGFARGVPHALVGARVIGRSPGTWFDSLRIDAGTVQGVRPDVAVITPAGVVGQVVAATSSFAHVQLLINPRTSVSAAIGPDAIQGILYGLGERGAAVRYVSPRAEIHVGDVVRTAGLDGVYPEGFVLGAVSEARVEMGKTFQDIWVEPAVRFENVERVAVVVTIVEQPQQAPTPASDENGTGT